MSKMDNDNKFNSKYTPLISIVVPIYDVAGYVEKCIKSIVEQSYSNLEIILVDDGSTDGSSIICDKYANKDSRIRVIHKENGGLVSARKAGVTVVQGEYVTYVDGDDWIEKDRIYNAVRQLQDEKVDILYLAGYYKDYGNSTRILEEDICEKTYYNSEIIDELMYLIQNPEKCFERKIRLLIWSWLFKKELIQKNQLLVDNRISLAEDVMCVLLALTSANSVRIIKENGYHYVQRETSLCYSTPNENIKFFINQMYSFVKKHNFDNIKNFVDVVCTMDLMLNDYDLLYRQNSQFLFPYSKVKRESRIVLYGAGRFGRVLLNTLRKENDYSVVLWVDQCTDRNSVEEYVVNPIEKIREVEFDYVVVAVIYEKDAEEIEQKLLSLNVNQNKIARMNIEEIRNYNLEALKELINL